jgi:hypothetical protein
MNRAQRMVLVVGAFLVVIVVWTAPHVQYTADGRVLPAGARPSLADVMDTGSALARGLAVLAAVGLVWYALGDRR